MIRFILVRFSCWPWDGVYVGRFFFVCSCHIFLYNYVIINTSIMEDLFLLQIDAIKHNEEEGTASATAAAAAGWGRPKRTSTTSSITLCTGVYKEIETVLYTTSSSVKTNDLAPSYVIEQPPHDVYGRNDEREQYCTFLVLRWMYLCMYAENIHRQ